MTISFASKFLPDGIFELLICHMLSRDCAICSEVIHGMDAAEFINEAALPVCSHNNHFCLKCARAWAANVKTCPKCRCPFTTIRASKAQRIWTQPPKFFSDGAVLYFNEAVCTFTNKSSSEGIIMVAVSAEEKRNIDIVFDSVHDSTDQLKQLLPNMHSNVRCSSTGPAVLAPEMGIEEAMEEPVAEPVLRDRGEDRVANDSQALDTNTDERLPPPRQPQTAIADTAEYGEPTTSNDC